MAQASSPKARPLSPHLQIWRWGPAMAVSILHNIERAKHPDDQSALVPIKAPLFIERYCSRIAAIPKELTTLALFVAHKVEDTHFIIDNTPHSVAAGVIYFVAQNCRLPVSKKDIKAVCGVSEVTINKCFKKLELAKNRFLPAVVIRKYAAPPPSQQA